MNTNPLPALLNNYAADAAERAALLDELPKLKEDYGSLVKTSKPDDEAAMRQATSYRTRIDVIEQRIVNLDNKAKLDAAVISGQAYDLARRALAKLTERRESKIAALADGIDARCGGEFADARHVAEAIARGGVGGRSSIPRLFLGLSKAIGRMEAHCTNQQADPVEAARQLLNQIQLAEAEAGEIK